VLQSTKGRCASESGLGIRKAVEVDCGDDSVAGTEGAEEA
jgi:hypothetical protein